MVIYYNISTKTTKLIKPNSGPAVTMHTWVITSFINNNY